MLLPATYSEVSQAFYQLDRHLNLHNPTLRERKKFQQLLDSPSKLGTSGPQPGARDTAFHRRVNRVDTLP